MRPLEPVMLPDIVTLEVESWVTVESLFKTRADPIVWEAFPFIFVILIGP